MTHLLVISVPQEHPWGTGWFESHSCIIAVVADATRFKELRMQNLSTLLPPFLHYLMTYNEYVVGRHMIPATNVMLGVHYILNIDDH